MSPARRSRLAWLHRWAGLVTGWMAFAIFLTGTLALFDTEITRWMQPESAIVPYNAQIAPCALSHAQQILSHEERSGAAPSFLLLPDPRDPTLRILHYNGHIFTGPVLDPRTGAIIHTRQTEGGAFFFNFHYTLRLPSPWGERMVACVAFAFAALVLSGFLIHLKRLVPDYFTLRLRASLPRSLLDLHVLTGSAMLPFHIMITWSGLILTAENALPLIQPTNAAHTVQEKPAAEAPSQWAPRASLADMLQQANTQLGFAPSYVLFDGGETTFSGIRQNSLNANDLSVVFDSQTGRIVSKTPAASKLENTFYIINGLHIARSMGPLLRWLWFGGGLGCTIMVASGLVYYTARQKKQAKPTFFLVQRLNIALLGGLVTACLGFLVCNRLIPASCHIRALLEVGVFFSIWATCLALALAYSPSTSRKLVSWMAGTAGIIIPVLDVFLLPLTTWETTLHITVNSLCALTGLLCIGSLYLLPAKNGHD